jgi:hypothetical protein
VWNKLYSASARSPPLLEFHGTADPVVPFSDPAARGGPNNTDGKRNQSCSATDTAAFLSTGGADNTLVPIPKAGHVPTKQLYGDPPIYNTTFWGWLLAKLKPSPDMCGQ